MTTPVTDPQPGKLYSDDNASIGVDPKRITADNTKTSDDAQTPDTKPFARLTNDNVSKSDAQEQPPAPLPVSSFSQIDPRNTPPPPLLGSMKAGTPQAVAGVVDVAEKTLDKPLASDRSVEQARNVTETVVTEGVKGTDGPMVRTLMERQQVRWKEMVRWFMEDL